MEYTARYFVILRNGKAEALAISGTQEPDEVVINVCGSREEAEKTAAMENSSVFRDERIARAGRIRRATRSSLS
jgi:hypothetical protein